MSLADTAFAGGGFAIKESIMKQLRRTLCFAMLALTIASPTASSQDVCAFCDLEFRRCLRSSEHIEVCVDLRSICYESNGCMVLY
jgi:hypothetical protein